MGPAPQAVTGWPELLDALAAQLPLLERLASARSATAVEQIAVQGRVLESRAQDAARRAGVRTCGIAPGVPGG